MNDDLKISTYSKIVEVICGGGEISDELIEYIKIQMSVEDFQNSYELQKKGINQIEAIENLYIFFTGNGFDNCYVEWTLANYDKAIEKSVEQSISERRYAQIYKILSERKILLDEESMDAIQKGIESNKCVAFQRLYTPTQCVKLDDLYFIADCWHNRVIYSNDLSKKISEWNTLDDDLIHPHSVCGYKDYILSEDTERNKVVIYKKDEHQKYQKYYELCDMGFRPHKLIFDEKNDIVIVLCGKSQELIGIHLDPNISVAYRQKIDELEDSYVRSGSFIDGKLYLVSGPGKITVCNTTSDDVTVEAQIDIPQKYYGMNDIFKFNEKYIISVYQDQTGHINPAFLVTESLDDLENCDYYMQLDMKGIPYFMTMVDGCLCVPEIDTYNRIVLYDIDNGIRKKQTVFDFGKATIEDEDFFNGVIL